MFNEASGSRCNEDEIKIVKNILDFISTTTFSSNQIPSLGIISPYREQVLRMCQAFSPKYTEHLPLTIDTIDVFQGQERDWVILSLVRSNNKNEIGVLQDYRCMNVPMTRARKRLVVIGNSATVG